MGAGPRCVGVPLSTPSKWLKRPFATPDRKWCCIELLVCTGVLTDGALSTQARQEVDDRNDWWGDEGWCVRALSVSFCPDPGSAYRSGGAMSDATSTPRPGKTPCTYRTAHARVRIRVRLQ